MNWTLGLRPILIVLAALSASQATAGDCYTLDDLLDTDTCLAAEVKERQKQMSDQSDEIVRRLDEGGDPESARAFLTSQTAWEAFTVAECSFRSFGIGSGSSRALVSLGCHIGLADARIVDLDFYLRCDEGDLSCRVPRD